MELIARGRDADVFALDAAWVLRRYRAGGDTRREAAVMRYVAGHGYPVPSVLRSDGPDLVLRRVDGRTLADLMASGGLTVSEGAQILADLHRRLHALPPRPDAPYGVVHLDLHPENVLLGAAGAVVIDWRNATDGPAELDLAVTAVILAEIAADPDHRFTGAASALLQAFAAISDADFGGGVPGAVGLRRADPALTTAEKARLDRAAPLVRAALDRRPYGRRRRSSAG